MFNAYVVINYSVYKYLRRVDDIDYRLNSDIRRKLLSDTCLNSDIRHTSLSRMYLKQHVNSNYLEFETFFCSSYPSFPNEGFVVNCLQQLKKTTQNTFLKKLSKVSDVLKFFLSLPRLSRYAEKV